MTRATNIRVDFSTIYRFRNLRGRGRHTHAESRTLLSMAEVFVKIIFSSVQICHIAM